MTNVSDGVSLASVKSEIFEAALWFLPEWAQLTVLGLIVLAVLVSWILKLKRKIAHRRAVRAGVQVHAAAQYGQGRGADYLGSYAPQNQQNQQNPPQQTAAASGPSGADFLGAYAPQQRRDDAR
jgi:thiol:disulfide interchange protein